MENLLNLNIKSVTIDQMYKSEAENNAINRCTGLPSYTNDPRPSTSQRLPGCTIKTMICRLSQNDDK